MSRHQNQIEPRWQIVLLPTIGFTQQPLFSIPFDSVAVFFRDAYPDSAATFFVENGEYQKMVIPCANAVVTATKVATAADTLFLRQQQWFGFIQGIVLTVPHCRIC